MNSFGSHFFYHFITFYEILYFIIPSSFIHLVVELLLHQKIFLATYMLFSFPAAYTIFILLRQNLDPLFHYLMKIDILFAFSCCPLITYVIWIPMQVLANAGDRCQTQQTRNKGLGTWHQI